MGSPVYTYCVLECDACKGAIGMVTDQAHPTRGLTICSACWANPRELPGYLKSTIRFDQVEPLL